MIRGLIAGALLVGSAGWNPGAAQDTAAVAARRQDSVVIRFVDADLRAVVQALGRYLAKPLVATNIPAERITLDYPTPVPRTDVLALLKAMLDPRGFELREETTHYALAPKAALTPAAPPQDTIPRGPIRLFVIRLRHAQAADVAATINLLYGGSGAFSGTVGLSGGTLSEELRRNVVPPAGPPAGSPETPQGPGAMLRGPVTVVPDDRTNSLLVRASQEDFDVVREAIEQLDIRPLQVLIEVLVVEARRDRSFSLGAALEAQRTDADGKKSVTLSGLSVGDLVLGLMRMGRTEVNALLATAQARGDVQIISRPVVLASNNSEARFLVGSQRPFVQVSRSLPTDVPIRDQVIQYKDVGTKLSVIPTINQDGYVSLLIQQEISAATAESQFDAPVISTREARTEVLVRDSQTIVLGGLSDQQRDRFQSGIPILSAIPIIGGLFGSASRRSTETELFLFVTARIIRTDEDADRLTEPRLPPAEVRREP